MIRAYEKAETLSRIMYGVPRDECAVCLTQAEAWELLDDLAAVQRSPNPVLTADIADAKERQDPWFVLQHFQLLGFQIVRAH